MKRIRKWTAGALALIALLSLTLPALAADAWEVSFTPTFGQSDARAMLDMINAFRTGDEAFYKDTDNTTLVPSKGAPLSYSYALEEIAMQRAAEIALSFSHTRPDGTDCFSLRASDGTTQSWGENIAAGSSTAQAAFKQWREDDEPYSGQGHRRNMLKTSYQVVGVGHAVLNGTHYWVQEFGFYPDSVPQTAAAESAQAVSVKIASSRLQSAGDLTANPESVSAEAGQSVAAPVVSASVTLADAWPGRASAVTVSPEWTSGDMTIATVSGQQVTGVKAGSVTLTGAALGKTVSVPVTVTGGGELPPAAYAITNAVTENGELSVTLSNPGGATVAAAYFNGNGQFVSASLENVQADAKTAALAFPTDAAKVRVMLFDGDNRPLCGCYEAYIG